MHMRNAAALAMLFSAPAFAVTTQGYDIPYAGVFYGFEVPDSSRDSDGGDGFQIYLGSSIDWGTNNAIELSIFDVGRERDADGGKDYQTAFFADLVHHYGATNGGVEMVPKFTPYVVGGLGLIQEDVGGDDHIHFGGSVGGGVFFPLPWHGLALRTEARAQLQLNDESAPGEDFLIDYRVNVGLQVPLYFLSERGFANAPAQECVVTVIDPVTGRKDCAVDSDADGVVDTADQCPATPTGVKVQANGCQ